MAAGHAAARSNMPEASGDETAQRKILIVEDEPVLREFLVTLLTRHHHKPVAVDTIAGMRSVFSADGFDLIVLDVNLPDGDGFDALKEVRQSSRVPVIMLTAANTPTDRVLGLEIGADDYIAKPFEPRELIARIKTVLRRAGATGDAPVNAAGETLTFAGFALDLDMRTLTAQDGQPIQLTGAEFDLLRCLAEAPGRPLSRDRILDVTRSRHWSPLDRSIDVLIGRLRKKLEPDSEQSSIIKTVRGIGYVMAVRVRRGHPGKA